MTGNAKPAAETLFGALKAYISRRLLPLSERLSAVESSAPKVRELTDSERTKILHELKSDAEAAHARWAIEFERSAVQTMLRAVDSIPEPQDGKDGADGERGEDGIDGMGFDDMEVEHDGERGFTIKLIRGDRVKSFSFEIPAMIYRDVYRDGGTYARGDTVTYSGSLWVALKESPGKPGDGKGWRLATKRGADGREGPRGPEGAPGRIISGDGEP